MKKFIMMVLSVGIALSLQSPSEARDLVKVDGSSTVFPITEAVAEEFGKIGGAKVMVGISGTGGGFKKFCRGETDISDASRPIKAKEVRLCRENGIGYIEIPVAYDGLAVVVNRENTWVNSLTTAELKKIWSPESQGRITNWSQVRAGFPNVPLRLFGPGTDSGTFDYFTKAINGKSGASRGDYTASEDDNILVEGVAQDRGGLGYFGLAYYEQNKYKLKVVPIDDGNPSNGSGPIEPTMQSVMDSTYQPLARPIFIYVSTKSLETKPYLKNFIEFYLKNAPGLVSEVGYIPLPNDAYQAGLARFQMGIRGSIFAGGPQVGVRLADLLRTR